MFIIGNKSFLRDCTIVILVDVDFFTDLFGADFFDEELSLFTFSSNAFCVLLIGSFVEISSVWELV